MRFARKIIFRSYFKMIVNFAIKNNGKILKLHGLMPARNIEDSQAMVVELQVIVLKKCLFIGAAMKEIF